jgi:hypothetical protein
MQIENDDQAQACPDIKDEVDAAPDPDQFRELCAVLGHPDEVEPGHGDEHREYRDRRGPRVFAPGVDENPGQ